MRKCGVFFAALLIITAMGLRSEAFAEESAGEAESEEIFIPEEYYEPIQSNSVEGWPWGEAIQASAGVVMDMDTGAFLYCKNPTRELYPASITKIMTCMLVLELGSLDDTLTCTECVYDLDDNAANIALSPGEEMSVRDALYALMLPSANDAANALAEYTAGSVSAFADLMNEKAASLGCTHTHFVNPNGLSNENHYTCARDMALIAQAAYQIPLFRQIAGTEVYTIPPTNVTEEERSFVNHHKMIRTDSDYYRSWCTGGKTGFTEAAWNTLVTYAEKDDMRLVCVLLHGNGANQNYEETSMLVNYGLDNFRHLPAGQKLGGNSIARLMKVNYLGEGSLLQAKELSQISAVTSGNAMITVPNSAVNGSVKTLSYPSGTLEEVNSRGMIVVSDNLAGASAALDARKAAEEEASSGLDWPSFLSKYGATVGIRAFNPEGGEEEKSTGLFYYTYSGWPVGSMRLTVNPLNLDLTLPWQEIAKVTVTGTDKADEVSQTNEKVWENVSNFVLDLDARGRAFYGKNRTALILIVGTILIVGLLALLIFLLRSTSEYRSRKKRQQAQQEAERIEEEIDAKTTAEIEQELREAMALTEKTEEDSSSSEPGREDHR